MDISDVDLSTHLRLETLVVQGVRSAGAWKLPPALRKLRFTPFDRSVIPADIPSTNIEILEIGGAGAIGVLRPLIMGGLSSETLRDLTLSEMTLSGQPDFPEILRRAFELLQFVSISENWVLANFEGIFKNVESLSLYQENLQDKDSEVVRRLFPRLRNLEVRSPRVTSLFFSDFIRDECAGSQLERIRLKECGGVDKDFVPWAKARGVSVSVLPAGLPAERRPKIDAFW